MLRLVLLILGLSCIQVTASAFTVPNKSLRHTQPEELMMQQLAKSIKSAIVLLIRHGLLRTVPYCPKLRHDGGWGSFLFGTAWMVGNRICERLVKKRKFILYCRALGLDSPSKRQQLFASRQSQHVSRSILSFSLKNGGNLAQHPGSLLSTRFFRRCWKFQSFEPCAQTCPKMKRFDVFSEDSFLEKSEKFGLQHSTSASCSVCLL